MLAKGSVSSELPWLVLSGLGVILALAGDAWLLWAAIRTSRGLRVRLAIAVAPSGDCL